MCVSNHHIVHPKLTQYYMSNYVSIKVEKNLKIKKLIEKTNHTSAIMPAFSYVYFYIIRDLRVIVSRYIKLYTGILGEGIFLQISSQEKSPKVK